MIERARRWTLSSGAGASLAGLLSWAAVASPASPSPGELDRSFGESGIVKTAFPTIAGSAASGIATVLQPDDKIVVLGTSHSDFALARYHPDGSLDTSFGDRGRVTTDLGGNETASAAVLQPDGKIVVVGSSRDRFALARYNPDGSLDPSFGDGGKVISGFRPAGKAIALRPDGKILVAGSAAFLHGRCDFILARYNPDGSLDASFGSGGEVRAKLGCGNAVVVRADGRIVVAGTGTTSRGDAGDFALARYNTDGSLDTSFGDRGRVTTDLGGNETASAAVLQPDGKIVVAGSSRDRLALARYDPEGSLDPSFGDGGKVVTRRPGSDRAKAVLLQRDGKIVVAGTGRLRGSALPRFAVARYNRNGSLDPSFGDRGQTISKPGQGNAAALEPDGKIIVAGSSSPRGHNPRQVFAVVRFDGGRTAPAREWVARAAQKRQGRDRPRPPHSVPAWYINANNFEELKRFAATDACAFARAQPRGAHRTLILDFGGARAYRDGSYGAAVNRDSFRARNGQIRSALKVAADAYASCHRRGQARIVYANTNHFDSKRSAHRAHRIGVHQSRTMRHVRAYERRNGYDPAERAGVAGDIEMAYWGPSYSKAMVDGAKSVWRHGYVDFGTAGACPPYPEGVHLHGCFNGWTVSGVAHVSNARGGDPVPEVYYRGGPRHFDQAAEWAKVARAWNRRHRSRYQFGGATGSTEFSRLSPRESWKLLRAKAPGRVRRELLNFQQDQLAKIAATKGRSGDASDP